MKVKKFTALDLNGNLVWGNGYAPGPDENTFYLFSGPITKIDETTFSCDNCYIVKSDTLLGH